MTDDPWEEPNSKRWIKQVLSDMAPKMRDSAVAISLVPGKDDSGDVKFWVELGAMIMYDKPIIAVVFGDRELPEHLERVADEIVRCPEGVDPASSSLIAEAIARVMETL